MLISIFRKGAPFRKLISLKKQRLIEAGLVDHWTETAIEAVTKRYRQEARSEAAGRGEEEEEALSLPQLQVKSIQQHGK